MSFCRPLLLSFCLLSLARAGSTPTLTLSPCGEVDSQLLPEISGLARGQGEHPLFWALNDSDEPAEIVALDAEGRTAAPAFTLEGARNQDWESICGDGQGRLFVGDTGNNKGGRAERTVYVIAEPQPSDASRVAVKSEIRFHFPANARWFDCEAMVHWRGSLWFLTKRRDAKRQPAGSTALYRLDPGSQEPALVGEREGIGGYVTDAAVSPDGKQLAVLVLSSIVEAQAFVWLFPLTSETTNPLAGPAGCVRLLRARQAESISWADDSTWLIANEERDWFRVPVPGK